MDDPYNLQRFVDAQDSVYADVCAELGSGRKRTHWMWFVFPQIRGLGSSAMAQRYAIASLAEAQAYLAHPVLGARLKETTRLVNAVEGASVEEIFGYPDDLKFHSSMTLFQLAASERGGAPTADRTTGSNTSRTTDPNVNPNIFSQALRKYFNGEDDAGTLRLL